MRNTTDDQDGDSDKEAEIDWDGDEDGEDDIGSGDEFIDVEQEVGAVGAAALDTTLFSQLCDDYNKDLALFSTPSKGTSFIRPLPPPHVLEKPSVIISSTSTSITIISEILDKMLASRTKHQSSTATCSKWMVQLNPKFTAPNNSGCKEDNDPKTRIKELVH